jgi:putative oxidoreductase
MLIFSNTFFLRFAVSVILIMHSVLGMIDGGVHDFGNLYLNKIVGFGALGLPLAWAIKISHLVCVLSFILDKYVKLMAGITIFILLVGIYMVHLPHGWFVVGKGTNGIEFNFLLIFALLTIMFPQGIKNNAK